MDIRITAALLILAMALSACGDGAGQRTETTTVTVTGTPMDVPSIPGAPGGDFQTTEALIAALYAEPHPPTDAASIRRYFIDEFVPGLIPAGDQSQIDFDWRVAGTDGKAEGLTITETAGGPTGGVVVTHFTNNGIASEIVWTVCRQPSGALRIVDGRRNVPGQENYDLRELVGLPPRAEGC